MLTLRKACRSEIDWINRSYDQVGFVHSNPDNEVIAIAEWEGEKAGLGRLIHINGTNFELGGIYVFTSFRTRGIARKIVLFLLDQAPPGSTIYCIAFENLITFYEQCGFSRCSEQGNVPQAVLNKHNWCLKSYSIPTVLLVMYAQ